MQKQVKTVQTQKPTNNHMSFFGLIEENMELPHIHLAVKIFFFVGLDSPTVAINELLCLKNSDA